MPGSRRSITGATFEPDGNAILVIERRQLDVCPRGVARVDRRRQHEPIDLKVARHPVEQRGGCAAACPEIAMAGARGATSSRPADHAERHEPDEAAETPGECRRVRRRGRPAEKPLMASRQLPMCGRGKHDRPPGIARWVRRARVRQSCANAPGKTSAARVVPPGSSTSTVRGRRSRFATSTTAPCAVLAPRAQTRPSGDSPRRPVPPPSSARAVTASSTGRGRAVRRAHPSRPPLLEVGEGRDAGHGEGRRARDGPCGEFRGVDAGVGGVDERGAVALAQIVVGGPGRRRRGHVVEVRTQ